ncbi:hypothetical protein J529_2491 [Acinetobacter baumannii 99063]|uniref:Uncharacterized protein n=2 Tax=Acinetobacter baumannii TaxID=470 RepID=A0A009SAU0_ACIBA|nr:hypothetical protein ACIN5111_0984 [Acinetobacter baumannii OIFC111]ETQ76610.1 hypothetical protein P667_1998 [Acinetobacter baumannii UH5107]EXA56528.1 hypothetical protein J505_2522 [Acinetobacter baumannii 1297549]EXB47751.1 hypothetical protein J540_2625 [Acinetobacter baumannii 1440422]EXC16714.1 hypothetical protein J533_1793 [Acinetobacter baumannii 4749]EXC50727.1 hypothetical protein J529_2491 [Acinetobacter baumannii 99063]EXE17229.1 hypothetical protein J558_2839 [Acinetobacter 
MIIRIEGYPAKVNHSAGNPDISHKSSFKALKRAVISLSLL